MQQSKAVPERMIVRDEMKALSSHGVNDAGMVWVWVVAVGERNAATVVLILRSIGKTLGTGDSRTETKRLQEISEAGQFGSP